MAIAWARDHAPRYVLGPTGIAVISDMRIARGAALVSMTHLAVNVCSAESIRQGGARLFTPPHRIYLPIDKTGVETRLIPET